MWASCQCQWIQMRHPLCSLGLSARWPFNCEWNTVIMFPFDHILCFHFAPDTFHSGKWEKLEIRVSIGQITAVWKPLSFTARMQTSGGADRSVTSAECQDTRVSPQQPGTFVHQVAMTNSHKYFQKFPNVHVCENPYEWDLWGIEVFLKWEIKYCDATICRQIFLNLCKSGICKFNKFHSDAEAVTAGCCRPSEGNHDADESDTPALRDDCQWQHANTWQV